MACPYCTPRRPVTTRLRLTLAGLGPEWTAIRHGAQRSYVHKLVQRYPAYEFRAHRTSLLGGEAGTWTIEARRTAQRRKETE